MSQLVQYTLEGKPFEPLEIKPYRWITIQEQNDFVNFIDSLGGLAKQITTEEKLSWCASEFEKYRCKNDPNHARRIKYLACGWRGKCPRCSMSYASKRAEIMYQWLRKNIAKHLPFDLKLNQIVLTLPEPLHDMDVKLFSKMIRKFMTEFGIEAYGYCNQTRHSKNPLDGKYLHTHILSLNIKKESNGIVQNAYYFDVERMRKVWKNIIIKNTGFEVEGEVDLHTEYVSVIHDPRRVKHLLSYLYRYPIEDLFKVQIRNKSINYVQFSQIENFDGANNTLQLDLSKKVYELTQEKKSRIVWCGLLTSARRKELVRLLKIDAGVWTSLVDVEKDLDLRAKCCLDCGCPLEDQPYDRGSYQADNEPELFQ